MKTMELQSALKCTLLTALLGALGVVSGSAQYTFTSGSDGSYGPLNILTNTTLVMPSDGIFRCTSIYVATNATLKFTPNALNTPVYLLATNDVLINGTIDVSGSMGTVYQGGAGGPGGFAGGTATILGKPPGDGQGPGAGRAGTSTSHFAVDGPGAGCYSPYAWSAYQPSTNNGTPYGSQLLIPLVGGSGGGGSPYTGASGAGGGGALLIAANTRIQLNGTLISTGGQQNGAGGNNDPGNAGSGGAVRLVAPVVAGGGTINVSGGNTGFYSGGSGRIRIDCMDSRMLAFVFNPNYPAATLGGNMVVIPANSPRLDIIQVAGTNIPVGAGAAVSLMLPQGSSTNQTVTVQASNFGALVPIRVVLTPDNGSCASYLTNIDNSANNPASVTVPVVVPVNAQVLVNAWTR